MRSSAILSLSMIAILFTGCVHGERPAATPVIDGVAVYTIQLTPQPGDNAPAIQAALKELQAHPGGRLVFAPGRYDCRAQGNRPVLVARELRGVEIDGGGATLVGHDLASLFVFIDCEGLTIRDLTVDWEPLPHTGGRVTSLVPEEHAFDMEAIVPAEPVPDRIAQAVLAYDASRQRLGSSGWEVYQNQGERDADPVRRLPDGRLRVSVRRSSRLPTVGWEVIVRHQVYGYNAIMLRSCIDTTIDGVTIHAAPGMGLHSWNCRDIRLNRVRIVPAAGGWMSTTADATHFSNCRGTITVTASEFVGMGDDAINIHSMYGLATERLDDRTLAVGRARMHPYYDKTRDSWDLPQPGDILEYSGGEEPLMPIGQLVVESAKTNLLRTRTVVTFRDPLPAGVGPDTVLSNISTSPAVRITGCTVRGNRARGFLLQTRDVVVSGCVFEDVSGAGIQICTDADQWWESLGARDVQITDCTFRRCNFGVASRKAALDIFSDLKGRQSAAGIHQRILIRGNTFEDNSRAAIHVGSAIDVVVRDNRISGATDPALIITNSRDVQVTGNIVTGPAASITIDGSAAPDTIRIEDNTGLSR